LAQIVEHASPWLHRVNDYDGCWTQQRLSKDPISRPNGVARLPTKKRNNMQGHLTMSNIELDRLQVLQKIMERRMTLTQYGRALHELGIEIICANTVAAKRVDCLLRGDL
jgi:hypothetical protein